MAGAYARRSPCHGILALGWLLGKRDKFVGEVLHVEDNVIGCALDAVDDAVGEVLTRNRLDSNWCWSCW